MKGRAPREHEIAAVVRGRYLHTVAGNGSAGALVGFHGYGENAEHHLEELERIPGSEQWSLCAIQALNRFYNTRTGEVIGSWMTKLGREQAIEDNIRYVSSVVAEVATPGEKPLVFAGFSQGVAMAYRAALRSAHRCDGLIVLAGDVPPEVAASGQPLPPVLLGRGTTDPLYSADQMNADLQVLGRLAAEVETCVFDSGHVWDEVFVEAAGRFLEKARARAGT